MHPDRLVDAYGDRLRAVGEDVYEARATFLRGQFDGYVADTFLVPDVGYVCWPAESDGAFDAYDDLLDAERTALEPLDSPGFELLAAGLSRVVLSTPSDAGDYVVKLGRCGMGGGFGDGRRANLVEAALSAGAGSDAPIVPSRYCSGQGTYAVYPLVEDAGGPGTTVANDAAEAEPRAPAGTGREETVTSVRHWLSEHAPSLDVDEAVAPENLCVWKGRLRTLDYSHPERAGPLGVPDHVDHEAVVRGVDERRGAGEKRDLRDGGGYAALDGEE